MECVALEPPLTQGEIIEIINIDFDIETLVVTVQIDGQRIDLSFDSPAGFRVLDEGDLLEFWPSCSSNNGWLYKISSSGWLEQESNRKGFLSSSNSALIEFFIIGCNYCVNVLAWEAPNVCESIR